MPQWPPQDLLPDICQGQGSGVPRHRTPSCSWLGSAPWQRAKPACPAPHPDGPVMSPSCFLRLQFSSPETKPCPRAPVSATRASHICAQQHISALALQRRADCVPPTPQSKDPRAFWAMPGLGFHAHGIMDLLLVKGLKVQIQKVPSRELLQPARHSRQGPHISQGPWLPKRTFRPSDIESQTSIQEAARLEEKGRKRKKGETKQK